MPFPRPTILFAFRVDFGTVDFNISEEVEAAIVFELDADRNSSDGALILQQMLIPPFHVKSTNKTTECSEFTNKRADQM